MSVALSYHELQKIPRKRRRWTEEEERSLLDGVRKHGIGAWAVILADNQLYFDLRTSVDLKDKWRVMTVRKPKNAPPLPLDLSLLSRVSRPKRTKDEQRLSNSTKQPVLFRSQLQHEQYLHEQRQYYGGLIHSPHSPNISLDASTGSAYSSMGSEQSQYMASAYAHDLLLSAVSSPGLSTITTTSSPFPNNHPQLLQYSTGRPPTVLSLSESMPVHHYDPHTDMQALSSVDSVTTAAATSFPTSYLPKRMLDSPQQVQHTSGSNIWIPTTASVSSPVAFSTRDPIVSTTIVQQASGDTPISSLITILQHKVECGQTYYLLKTHNGASDVYIWRTAEELQNYEHSIRIYHLEQEYRRQHQKHNLPQHQQYLPSTSITTPVYVNNYSQYMYPSGAPVPDTSKNTISPSNDMSLTTLSPPQQQQYYYHRHRQQQRQIQHQTSFCNSTTDSPVDGNITVANMFNTIPSNGDANTAPPTTDLRYINHSDMTSTYTDTVADRLPMYTHIHNPASHNISHASYSNSILQPSTPAIDTSSSSLDVTCTSPSLVRFAHIDYSTTPSYMPIQQYESRQYYHSPQPLLQVPTHDNSLMNLSEMCRTTSSLPYSSSHHPYPVMYNMAPEKEHRLSHHVHDHYGHLMNNISSSTPAHHPLSTVSSPYLPASAEGSTQAHSQFY